MTKIKWKVNIIDNRKTPGEISLVREDFKHGMTSYGWFEERKIPIWSLSSWSDYELPEIIWDELIKTAHKLANKLNKL